MDAHTIRGNNSTEESQFSRSYSLISEEILLFVKDPYGWSTQTHTHTHTVNNHTCHNKRLGEDPLNNRAPQAGLLSVWALIQTVSVSLNPLQLHRTPYQAPLTSGSCCRRTLIVSGPADLWESPHEPKPASRTDTDSYRDKMGFTVWCQNFSL